MSKSIKTIALETIEGMILANEEENEKLQACYRFAHIALERCGNPHTDWVQELKVTHQILRDNKII